MDAQSPLLELQDIKTKKGVNKLEIYSMKVYAGVFYQIHGSNGSSKSLLLDILSHQLKPKNGNIFFDGKSSDKGEYSGKKLRESISYLKQVKPKWNFNTVIAYLQKAMMKKNKTVGTAHQEVMDLLEKYDLSFFAGTKRSCLSPGVFKKVELLKVLIEESDIILLDEPYAGLDENFIKKFNYALRTLVKTEKMTAIISSATSLARFRLIDVSLVLHRGRIVKVEKPQRIQSRPKNNYKKRTQQ